MQVDFDIEGLDKLNKSLMKALSKMPRERALFLRKEAELVKGRTKLLTPVDTGYLRSSWQSQQISADAVEIYNNVEYAGYVEEGHRVKIHGKYTGRVIEGAHMLRDAVFDSQTNFKSDAQKLLAQIFK